MFRHAKGQRPAARKALPGSRKGKRAGPSGTRKRLHAEVDRLELEVRELRAGHTQLEAECLKIADLVTAQLPRPPSPEPQSRPLVLEMLRLSPEWFKGVVHHPVLVRLSLRAGASLPQPLLSVYPKEWRCGLRVRDNHGNVLSLPKRDEVVEGVKSTVLEPRAESGLHGGLTGLRFTVVSKNFGGAIRLCMKLTYPEGIDDLVDSVEYTMRVQTKPRQGGKHPHECSDTDPLWVIRGIGSTYASKFAELDFISVGDLRHFPRADCNESLRHSLLVERISKLGPKSSAQVTQLLLLLQQRLQEIDEERMRESDEGASGASPGAKDKRSHPEPARLASQGGGNSLYAAWPTPEELLASHLPPASARRSVGVGRRATHPAGTLTPTPAPAPVPVPAPAPAAVPTPTPVGAGALASVSSLGGVGGGQHLRSRLSFVAEPASAFRAEAAPSYPSGLGRLSTTPSVLLPRWGHPVQHHNLGLLPSIHDPPEVHHHHHHLFQGHHDYGHHDYGHQYYHHPVHGGHRDFGQYGHHDPGHWPHMSPADRVAHGIPQGPPPLAPHSPATFHDHSSAWSRAGLLSSSQSPSVSSLPPEHPDAVGHSVAAHAPGLSNSNLDEHLGSYASPAQHPAEVPPRVDVPAAGRPRGWPSRQRYS